MSVVRFRYRLAGGHVHVRVFTGPDLFHLALAGELNERVDQWRAFRRAMGAGGEFLCEDEPDVRETYDLMLDGVLVTTRDLDTGEGETMQLPADSYVLVCGANMELTHEQVSPTTGSRVLTLKRRPPQDVVEDGDAEPVP